MTTVRTVMIGEKKFRLPFLDLIPMPAADAAALKQSIQDTGAVLEPLVVWAEQRSSTCETVIDGANRTLYAAEIGLTKVPVRSVKCKDEAEAKELCRTLNYHRRHLSPEAVKQAREERIARVAEARTEGKSTRAIAEAEGISDKQVRDDLEKATAKGYAVEPEGGKVKGKDGKGYPKEQPPKAQSPGAKWYAPEGDSAATNAPTVSPGTVEPPEAKPENVLTDPAGVAVPARLRHHFGDPWLLQTQDLLALAAEKIRSERLATVAKKKGPHFPFFNCARFIDVLTDVDNALDQLVDMLKDGRPVYVCPACEGQKCHECLQSGLVPLWKYQEMKGGKK